MTYQLRVVTGPDLGDHRRITGDETYGRFETLDEVKQKYVEIIEEEKASVHSPGESNLILETWVIVPDEYAGAGIRFRPQFNEGDWDHPVGSRFAEWLDKNRSVLERIHNRRTAAERV